MYNEKTSPDLQNGKLMIIFKFSSPPTYNGLKPKNMNEKNTHLLYNNFSFELNMH